MQDGLLYSVVASRAGRDAGRYFIVMAIENGHALLCDGALRKLEKPKRKKLMHVKAQGVIAEDIKTRLTSGEKVLNADVRKCLEALGFGPKQAQKGD